MAFIWHGPCLLWHTRCNPQAFVFPVWRPMRDEQYLTVAASPIIPAMSGRETGGGTTKKDNVADVLARLDRMRDGKFTSPADRAGQETGSIDLSFADLIDTINPLQHIPVVSSIYRAMTGDEISPAARLAGDSLFLGPIGAASALFDLGVEAVTDAGIGEHVVGLFRDDGPADPATETADGTVAPQDAESGGNDVARGFLPVPEIMPPAAPGPTGNVTFAPGSRLPEQPTGQQVAWYRGAGDSGAWSNNDASRVSPDFFTAPYGGQPLPADAPTTQTAGPVAPDSPTGPTAQAGPVGQPASGGSANPPGLITRPQISADMVARVYDGSTRDHPVTPDTAGYQSGWIPSLMPEVISRYQHSATLQRPDQASFVDIRD